MATERQTQNPDATLIAKPAGDPDAAAMRNSRGRVFLADGEAYSVVVHIGGERVVMAKGVARSRAGKACALYLTLRAEGDVDIPAEPTEFDPEAMNSPLPPRLE